MPDAPKIYERNFQLSKPEQSLTAAQQTFTAKAKSVDEIIASLRSGSHSTSQTASDQKIKGLLERVFGYSYSSKSEEVTDVTAAQKKRDKVVSPKSPAGKTSVTDSQRRAEKHIKKKITGSITEVDHKVRLVEETTRDLDSAPISIITSPGTGKTPTSTDTFNFAQVTPSILFTSAVPGSSLGALTNEEAEKVLALRGEVTFSDIINIKGNAFGTAKGISEDQQMLLEKEEQPLQQASALATWTAVNKARGYQTIHHFCTVEPSHVLPIDLQLASKLYYTPSRKGYGCSKLPESIQQEADEICSDKDFTSSKQQEIARLINEGIPTSEVTQENVQGGVRALPPLSSEFLLEWQRIAEYYVERPRIMLIGESMQIYKDATKLLWTPAFPKFAVPISHVKETLFPKLQVELDQVDDFAMETFQSDQDFDMDEEQENLEEKAAMLRTLFKKHSSLPDLRVFSFYSSNESFRNHFEMTTSESTVHHPEEKRRIIVYMNLNKTIDKPSISLDKHYSLPNLCYFDESSRTISAPFQTLMKEIELQRQQLIQTSLQTLNEHMEIVSKSSLTTEVSQLLDSVTPSKLLVESQQPVTSISVVEPVVKTKKPKRRKKIKAYMRKPLLPRKIAFAYRKLSMAAKPLNRSESLPSIVRLSTFGGKEPRTKVLRRNSSLPTLFDFEGYVKKQGGVPKGAVAREWVRDIWNMWFDDVFPPLKPSSETAVDRKDSPLASKEKESSHLHTDLKEIELLNLQPPTEQDETAMYPVAAESEVTRATLQSAISELTYQIAVKGEATAFNYCRRGAVNRRLGQLKSAMEDLNKAIKLEPRLLNAYWQRHFIYLLQFKTANALDDLNFVLKHNKNHADAYTSKGDIYRNRGDITLAIINYSQGLKCRPDDDVHFKRAEMYEKNNDLLMAMEDYLMAFNLNPKRTDAMIKRGLFYFENSNWHLAIQDLTTLIKWDPINAKARNYRGQAYAKQGMFKEAIEDLSSAVHLDPNNWTAFYHRGCLLRKLNTEKALQDFSVSVLINSEVENLDSFLHRGILYTELGEWQEAIFDFESVVKLDRSISFAHINLGLIFLLKMDHHYEAIRRFTNALKAEPTSVRAYVCRAQANHKIHNLKSALKDITCAIHLQPQTHYFYLLRGQYLYEMKNFELASFCIQYSAEINEAPDSSPIQQATVQLFLKNYDKAINILSALEKTTPILTLLGKGQMKARKHEDAVISFQKVLDLESEVSDIKVTSKLKGRAELYYHMGLCYIEQNKLREAVDSFNNALKLHPKFAKAYYQRGLCRMKLHEFNCIHDFHRALAMNPQLFEVYLSRAIYYAMQGRICKAILSCNEALKLEPRSIRAFLCRGALKFYSKAYELAVDDLTSAININSACILGYFNRAVCYQKANDLQKALKDYGIVLLLGSQKKLHLKVLVNRGLLYLRIDDYCNALKDFQAATVEEPENAHIHHAVAICCHKLLYLEEAVKGFNQAVKLDPFFADAYNGRGNVYMDSVHEAGIKQAQKDFVRALHLDPKSLNTRLNLGYNFQVLGRFQKAWNQFTIAIDIDPTFEVAYEGRAVVNLQMNNTFGAFQDINAALQISMSAKLLTNRGVISQFTGDLPNAMRDYQKAITLDHTYSLAYFNAANLYFYNKQFSQAHDYYTKAIDLQPKDESALLNRAICRVLLRRAEEAFEDFAEAIKLSPYSAHIYFNRANLYATLKQYKDAEKDYSQALQLMPDDALFYKLRADVRGHLGMTEEAVADYKQAIVIQETG
ncbi:uncharacterized protein ttc6 [Scyliorhinus canicula]|uniref:uncharacterized protein ttc6 n=1 Tax=Scyliorhinus canicula TaxID=7830 RepID=UPI0018F36923|nr:uncharacterized protein ttc6 [Scyliorhinus canicula]